MRLLVIFFFAATLAGAAPCVPNYIRLNLNAKTPRREYRQTNLRDLELYQKVLGISPSTLKSGDVVIDSGSGFGIAALQMARRKGLRVYAINTQNNFESWLLMAKADEKTRNQAVRLSHSGGEWINFKGIGDLDEHVSLKVAEALGISTEKLSDAALDEPTQERMLVRQARKVLDRFLEKVRDQSFHYKVGYSEAVIPQIPGEATLITDFWGAYAYSPARILLLETFYRKLSAQGQVHIYVPGKWAKSMVSTREGSEELHQYLLRKFPNIFSIQRIPDGEAYSDGVVLVMKRDPDLKTLKIRLKTQKVQVPDDEDGFSPANIVLREI